VQFSVLKMILLICLWQQVLVQSLVILASWPVFHFFFIYSMGHISAHSNFSCQQRQNGTRQRQGPCKIRVIESVRALLALTHSFVIPLWGAYLLFSDQSDVQPHVAMHLCSLSYHLYESWWTYKDNFGKIRRTLDPLHHRNIYDRKPKPRKLVHHFIVSMLIIFTLRAMSLEMAGWRNAVVPLLMDYQTSSWNHPGRSHRKALSQHLLTKPSTITALVTGNLIMHELPYFILNIMKLRYMSGYTDDIELPASCSSLCTRSDCNTGVSLGADPYRRERNCACAKEVVEIQRSAWENILTRLHCYVYLSARVFGGIYLIKNILATEILVRDTAYVSVALLNLGLGLSHLIELTLLPKRFCPNSKAKESLSWQLAASFNEAFCDHP